MTIKITLEKKEYDLILKLIQPKINQCEEENNYGGDYGETLREIKYAILYGIKVDMSRYKKENLKLLDIENGEMKL
jgi:CRISPR/Cas system-associated protein Cas5 (RAMP superfamily)|tara:strand:- start:255 stop:482 length:228 start_codon:yes stop_codon:yes gene_type:complete